MRKSGFIYVVTGPTGFRYVGQTVQKVDCRWRAHISQAGKRTDICRYLHSAIRKYGSKAFSVQTLGKFARSDLNYFEARAVACLRTLSPHGYNLTAGGDSPTEISAESRAMMSKAGKGRPKSPEHKARIGAGNTGNTRPDLAARNVAGRGRKASKEERINLINAARPKKSPYGQGVWVDNTNAKNPYCVRVSRVYLGCFPTPKAAQSARRKWLTERGM